jgi:hypothetical protein
MSTYGGGIMMSNYLDPIAKMWGCDCETIGFAKVGHVPKDLLKKIQEKVEEKNHS